MNISKEELERIEKDIDVWIREEYHDRTPNKTHVGIANMIASYRAGATHEHLYMMEKLVDRWISVKDRLPENTKGIIMFPSWEIGFYTESFKTVVDTSEDDDDNNDNYDHDPNKGESYLKAGFYVELEQGQSVYDFMFFQRSPTHWQPLPSPPLNKPEPPKV